MPPIPDTEPTRLTAGDTIGWTVGAGNFSSLAGYSLAYYLQGPGQISIAATADDDGGFTVSVPGATTIAWAPGSYVWSKAFTDGSGNRYTVGRGTVSVLANPALPQASTHAQRTLGLIKCALEGRIPRGLEHTDIDGQSLSRIPLEQLYALKQKYKQEVMNERLAQRAAEGLKTKRTIGIRFVNPRAPGWVPHAD